MPPWWELLDARTDDVLCVIAHLTRMYEDASVTVNDAMGTVKDAKGKNGSTAVAVSSLPHTAAEMESFLVELYQKAGESEQQV